MTLLAGLRALVQRLGPRRLGFIGAFLVIIAGIAVLGPALRPAETAETDQQIDPVPAATSVASPTPTPRPTPTSLALPVAPTSDPADQAVEPDLEDLPREPDIFASVRTIGGVTVAIDSAGVWTKGDVSDRWTLTPFRDSDQQRWCTAMVQDTLAFVHLPNDGSATISVFDPALPGWRVGGTTRLPALTNKGSIQSGGFCRGTTTADGRAVFSTSTEEALVFAIGRQDGSFRSRTVSFPAGWIRGSTPDFVEADTFRNADAIAVRHCSYYIDTGCLTTYFGLDAAVLAADGPSEMTWSEAGGSVILPSEVGVATVYADLGGSTSRGFHLVQIRDEAWTVELIEQLGSSRGPDFSTPVGRWAVGPLGTTPSELGTGYWPSLSLVDGNVVASMQPLGEPSPDGPWGWSADDDQNAVVAPKRWWRFDTETHAWVALDADPTGTPPRVPPEQPLSPPLRWSSNSQSSSDEQLAASEVRSWEEVVGQREPILAGDLAFMRLSQSLWSSNDGGTSWTIHDTLPWRPENQLCGAAFDVGLAYLVEGWNRPTELVITSADSTQRIGWPVAPHVYLGDRGFSPCRPLRVDGRWWLAEVDHDLATLRLSSTSDGQTFSTHVIDMTGEWSEALPDSQFRGTADLYYDEGWFVVRLCRPAEGYACNESVELRLNAATLEGGAGASDLRLYKPDDVEMAPPTVGWGLLHNLHQVGDQLWSVELNTFGDEPLDGDPNARVGRFGNDLAAVDGLFAEVRSRNGQPMRCVYAQRYQPGPPQQCEVQTAGGSWQPVLGTIAVDWATVPSGTSVSFWQRTDDGQILVVPS